MRFLRILKALVPSLTQALVIGAILITAVVAYNAGARHTAHEAPATKGSSEAPHSPPLHAVDANGDGIIYACSMHPQIQQDEPGNCPICGMELVATKVGESAAPAVDSPSGHDHSNDLLGYACAMNCVPPLKEPGKCPVCGMEMQPVSMDASSSTEINSPRTLTMSPEAVALANVETTEVRRGPATRAIHLVGQLVEDPRRRFHLSANVGGRIDVLHARFDRDTIEAGQPIAEIYSPELVAVQEELLQALASSKRWESEQNATLARSAQESVVAIRRRLLLAGLAEHQIDSIQEGGKAMDRLTLHSPFGGIVTARFVEEGQYVEREQRIGTIADYRVLWAELEAFNSDLSAIESGLSVTITTPAQPDRIYQGTVDWVDPLTTSDTRTTRVRVVLENSDLALNPGMYVRATLTTRSNPEQLPLLIPHTAALLTGRRAIVYTMDTAAERPTFVGREVELGDRVEEGTIVVSGLSEGERVVTRGAFQIDSSLQILARPSMMNPQGGRAIEGHGGHGDQPDHSESGAQESAAASGVLSAEGARLLLPSYLKVQSALAADDFDKAKAEWATVVNVIAESGDHGLHGLVGGIAPSSIAEMRVAFEGVSSRIVPHLKSLGQPVVHVHCPMAFDWKGADWLQVGREVANPYFGAEMLGCGSIKDEVKP